MIQSNTIVALAVAFAFVAMVVVIILLLRTTRKVVDKNTALSEKLSSQCTAEVNTKSPIEQIKQDLSHTENPAKMSNDRLMILIDEKMEELALYQNPDLDLKSASKALGLSQRHILRIFKEHPGYGSFNQYLTEKRLAKACRMLTRHPEYTIEAICLDAGFRSRRTFQTAFKSRIGMSPSEYRNAMNNKNENNN